MGGGLMQLVAYGAQDVYLTGNPQITFFKTLYKRYSNFSINIYEQNINGTPFFNNNINCLISKTGDLLKTIYFEIILPDLNKSEIFILFSLVFPIIFFGFYPEPLLNTTQISVENLIELYNINLNSNLIEK